MFSLIAFPNSYLPTLPTNSFSEVSLSIQDFIKSESSILPKLKLVNFSNGSTLFTTKASIINTIAFNPLDFLNKVLDKFIPDPDPELIPSKVVSTPIIQPIKSVSPTPKPPLTSGQAPLVTPLFFLEVRLLSFLRLTILMLLIPLSLI